MKGLSVLLTLALLILAHQLSIFVKRAASLPTAEQAKSSTAGAQLPLQLLAQTNSRGLTQMPIPDSYAQNQFLRRSQERSNQSPILSLEL
jgi:hypothetical protein